MLFDAYEQKGLLFNMNIKEAGGMSIAAIGMQEGLIWNELIDIAALDKGDFKGQFL